MFVDFWVWLVLLIYFLNYTESSQFLNRGFFSEEDSEEEQFITRTEPPTLYVSNYYSNRSWQEDWKLFTLQNKELAIVSAQNGPVLHLVCTALEEIGWYGLGDFNERNVDITKGSEYTVQNDTIPLYTITLSIQFKTSLISGVSTPRCEYSSNNVNTRINIFVLGKSTFLNPEKIQEYNEKETWVRCPSGNPNRGVILLHANPQKNGTLKVIDDYLQHDPFIGFQLKQELQGEYVCYAGETEFIRFLNSNYLPQPTLKITNYVPNKSNTNDWDTLNLPNNTLGVLIRDANNSIVHLVCTAPYAIGWYGRQWLKEKRYEFAEEGRKFPLVTNLTVTFSITMRIKFRRYSIPAIEQIRCEHLKRNDSAKIHFFLPGEKVLINSKKIIKYNKDDSFIRCPTSDPTVKVKLNSISNATANYTKERIGEDLEYNPLVGFQLNNKLKGVYVCEAGEGDAVMFAQGEEDLLGFGSSEDDAETSSSEEENFTETFQKNKAALKFILQQRDINLRCQDEDLALINQAYLYKSIIGNLRVNRSTSAGNQLWIQVNKNLTGIFEIPIFQTAGGNEDYHLVDVICIQQNHLLGNNTIQTGRVTKKWTAYPVRKPLTKVIVSQNESYYSNTTDDKPFQTVTWESIPFDEHIFMVSDGENILHTNFTSSFLCKTAQDQLNLTFWLESANGYEYQLQNGSFNSTLITIEKRDFFHFKGWTLSVKLPLDAVAIKCKIGAVKQHPSLYYSGEKRFKTKDLLKPAITTTVSSKLHQFHESDTYKHIACHASAEPEPKYIWEKDGQVTENLAGFKQRIGKNGESILDFPEIRKGHGGTYKCKAFNKLGMDQLEFTVTVEENPKEARERRMKLVTIITVVTVVLCALAICGFGIYRYYSAKALMRGLTEEEIKDFFEGRPELAKNAESQPFGGDFDVLPYDTSFEIDFSDAVLDFNSILGSGEFAVVVKGSIKSKGMDVAVKIAKATADVTLFKSLLSEVKILSYIGSHSNIAGLVGVNTADIQKKNIYIYMDLCELGSLEKYLRIVHADLAARNVLLTREKTVRVSDFGLSKKLYECNLYVKKTKCPLPWRWMALESLQTLAFSSESDVWSFGVTLWEIFTLGDVPFPNEEWNKAFVDMLICGIRMGKPEFATTEIFSVIQECWDGKSSKRPAFSILRSNFYTLLGSIKTASVDVVYSKCEV